MYAHILTKFLHGCFPHHHIVSRLSEQTFLIRTMEVCGGKLVNAMLHSASIQACIKHLKISGSVAVMTQGKK